MLKFSRRKTSSKGDETRCSPNGCVDGLNGHRAWSSGTEPVGTEGDSLKNGTYDDCVGDQRKPMSAGVYHDAQNRSRLTKPLSVLHVLRDKLKPSTSKSRPLDPLDGADCASATGHCTSEVSQDCCELTAYVNGSVYDVIEEDCGEASCSGLDDTNDKQSIENCRSRLSESLRVSQSLSTNSLSTCTRELTTAADRSNQRSDSAAELRSCLVKPQPMHGGLVLSQLSNIVSVETCMKSDPMSADGLSRLPLSPLSSSDVGLDTPDDRQPVKWTLANELLRLSKYGWYWGPVSREEAEEKLAGQPEGAFLVRDSTDDRYLFSLSFRSSGRTLHTRVEYCNGEFSFYAQPRSDSYRSMAELIEQCVAESQSGIYCYSRGTSGVGSQSYPVKLTRPVSRFAQVRSLQYLCRFVIRQHTRVDHIQNLPLPISVKGWLKENQY